MTVTGNDEEDTLKALQHPMRRKILRHMGGVNAKKGAILEEVSPRDLALALRQPLSNVSYHVRVLADFKAITSTRVEPVRGTLRHFYRLSLTEPWALQILNIKT